MKEIIPPPAKTESPRYEALNKLKPGESILIPLSEQPHYSRIASQFHKITDKRFTTARKGQPEGKARVWRIQ